MDSLLFWQGCAVWGTPPVEKAAYCAAAAGLPVPNTMTFAPIGVRL